MKVTKEITTLENSAVSLTIKVGKKDVAACYNDVVAKHAKTIQIPGFRKGKAPISVLEKKLYGMQIKSRMTAAATKMERTPVRSTRLPLKNEQTIPPAVLIPPDQPKNVPRSSALVVLARIT